MTFKDEHNLKHVYEELLLQLNSISNEDVDLYNGEDLLDSDKQLMRKRILLVNNNESLNITLKTKLIQKLMMHNEKANLHLSDIYIHKLEDEEYSNDRQINFNDDIEIQYTEESDYNIINDIECTHFVSDVKIYSDKTGLWYSCKNCYLSSTETSTSSVDNVSSLTHLQCGKCLFVDTIAKDTCLNCENKFAEFCCLKCRIFEDNDENDIYHCPYCKECKLGEGLGIDYKHCFDCNCCMPLEMFHNQEVSHKCIKNNLSSDCPICGVKLNEHHHSNNNKNSHSFDSLVDNWRVQFLIPCNHAIHETCLKLYLDNGQYKCPICQISIVDMEINFKLLDEEIQNCALPSPYNTWRCVYKCNDCDTRGITSYHFLGIKCRSCYSFNTILLQVLKNNEDDIKEETEVGNTKRSTVSKEMVDNSFMSRKDAFKGKNANDMDGFLNDFLSKDEDLSLSHLLVGLKQYYSSKKNVNMKTNNSFENFDPNKVYNRMKSNFWNKVRGTNQDLKFASDLENEDYIASEEDGRNETNDTEYSKQDLDSETEEEEEEKREKEEQIQDILINHSADNKNILPDNNRLLNDIGDSFKQFLKLLEDNENHEE